MSFIIIVAVKGVGTLIETKCNTDTIEFQQEVMNIFNKYSAYGVVEEHNLKAPCEMELICFIDSNTNYMFEPENKLFPINFPYEMRKVLNNYNNGTQYIKNVFSYKDNFVTELGYSNKIQI
ncbi:MAG: hypothetical protein AB7V77_04115, partial [Candidatus Woesearchaeota archaeon]